MEQELRVCPPAGQKQRYSIVREQKWRAQVHPATGNLEHQDAYVKKPLEHSNVAPELFIYRNVTLVSREFCHFLFFSARDLFHVKTANPAPVTP